MTIAHKNIKRYHIDGIIGDEAALPRMKDELIGVLKLLMKRDGYAPRYDIDPDFTVDYTGEAFKFDLSLYGVHVGRKQAKCIKGVDKNREIFTPPSKSSARLSPAA